MPFPRSRHKSEPENDQRGVNTRAFWSIKLLLILIIALFAAASVYTAVIINDRHEALRKAARFNIAWLASQAAIELERFTERVGSYDIPGSGVDAAEVQLRFEILQNRAGVFEQSEMRSFTGTNPEVQQIVDRFAYTLAEAEPLVASIDRPGVALKVRAIVLPLATELVHLAAAAFQYGANQANADQQDLIQLHWRFSELAVGLICCSMALMLLLIRHNGLLAAAHRKHNELAANLWHASSQLNAAMDNMSQGLCLVDNQQRLIVCNKRFLSLFDLTPDTAKPGRAIGDVLAESRHVLHGFVVSRAEHRDSLSKGTAASYLQNLDDGRTLAISHQPMPDGGWVATYQDITERRQAEARIAHLAHHDVLTDLPNRTLFLERLDAAFARARPRFRTVAVLSLDLDRFKSVNDTFGHPFGDKLLREVARRLRQNVRETDTVARFGGDEFAILQTGQEQPTSADALARRLVQVIGAPYHLDGVEVTIGISIGISVAQSGNFDELLTNADMALYRAKGDGRGSLRFFDPEMDAEVQTRRALEIDLRQALLRKEFELLYQAIVNLQTYEIVGYEALLRWNHPEAGVISPAIFIPIAEEIGLISAIGDWVICRACEDAAGWPDHIKVAINLSPVQFRNRGLVSIIVSSLASSGLSPHRLELEITESALLQHNEATLATLHELRALGSSIAMDDFGTGFSSLSYLRSFPFDKIKIDRSFVQESERPDCLAIVQSVASLATKLNMSTTAEGVETWVQLERVRQAGCTEVQGFLFARPKRLRDLTHTVALLEPEWPLAVSA